MTFIRFADIGPEHRGWSFGPHRIVLVIPGQHLVLEDRDGALSSVSFPEDDRLDLTPPAPVPPLKVQRYLVVSVDGTQVSQEFKTLDVAKRCRFQWERCGMSAQIVKVWGDNVEVVR